MDDQKSNDHDLLIELRTEMRGLRADLKIMRDGIQITIGDHEKRIRSLEDGKSENSGSSKTWSVVAGIVGSAISLLAQWAFQHK